jgi:hypothetical protein
MLLKIAAILLMATAPTTNPLPQLTTAPQSTPAQLPKTEKPADCKGRTFASAEEAMQSGCCSWHGGVCGCSNGRKTCCDGETSPSCKC